MRFCQRTGVWNKKVKEGLSFKSFTASPAYISPLVSDSFFIAALGLKSIFFQIEPE